MTLLQFKGVFMDFAFVGYGLMVFAVLVFVYVMATLRKVVPTNMVHIVQSSKKTTPYGPGKPNGNTYYAWPSWVPVLGVNVTLFPESIFQVSLTGYEAYDSARLPFVVDITSFFRVDHAETVAQRVANFQELEHQLLSVLQGAVRRILATNALEDIMQERSSLGAQFTEEVKEQIKEWGVLPVKMIEFMDIRDQDNAEVIANIMAKEKSRIERESRVAVANNMQEAQLKEIDAQRTVDVQRQDAEQQVGLRVAEKDRTVGIANEQSRQEVLTQTKVTAERDMEVKRVNEVKQAEISKDVAIVKAEQDQKTKVIEADADKQAVVVTAEGNLEAARRDAEGVRLKGLAAADAEKAMLMAPVDTQITLAKEIGENEGYQKYLITIKQVEISGNVGSELAKAMQNADLKVIANSNDVQSGVSKLGDMFTAKGGTNLTGMLAALAQTDEGQAVINKFTGGSVAN